MKYKALETKRQFITGKIVVGIDPGKQRHQGAVLDRYGVQLNNFTFKVSYYGYHTILWKKLEAVIAEQDFKDVVFALETSCNLWQTLAHYLHYSGYPVLLVSPLTTYHSRSFISHDFSHTDPKDALLMASNARSGYFDFYRSYSSAINGMHELSMTYCKARRNLLQQRARLQAYMGYVFPEFLQIVNLDTETARYLLKDYFLPEHYLSLDVESVGAQLARISQNQYGTETLKKLQAAASRTIGIIKSDAEVVAGQLAIQTWLSVETHIKTHLDQIKASLIELGG
ncbi:MAG: transposase [bacterium]